MIEERNHQKVEGGEESAQKDEKNSNENKVNETDNNNE